MSIRFIDDSLVDKFYHYIGEEGLRYFKHLKGLKGTCSPVLKLNAERKGIPAHPVHMREGMQIRNFLRQQKECKDWTQEDLDKYWTSVVEQTIEKYLK